MTSATGHHRILERQLRRLGLSTEKPPDTSQWPKLLDVVSASYRESDTDRYMLERSIEVSFEEMRALHEVLRRQARQDALTGLLNRSALTELLGEALVRHRAGDLAVLFVDLDNFKLVNDSLGHSAGDELLVNVAQRICHAVGQHHVVSRLGGDEFVVICVDVHDVDAVMGIARRIAADLEQPFDHSAQEIMVSASIGIAFAGAGDTTDDLLRRADMAMYEAKTGARSQFVIFDDDMQQRIAGRLATEHALRNAVSNEELVLHYQPVVALPDRQLLGFEALLRWDRPGHGVLTPDMFIPIAEETRLTPIIDAWVIEAACRQAVAWEDLGATMAVNLSARDLRQPDLVDKVSDVLRGTGLAAHHLVMEITESTLVSDDPIVAANLVRVNALGIQLAIDDFGTGYSSFASLRQLPAQTLKIDQSFVARLGEDDASAAIAGAIINMGHALGLRIVAEGVERPVQEHLLQVLGCDAAQGYLFAPPQPAAALERYLAAR
ncbi:EAL domain-containing protein [Micromonospora sp. CPCC 205371]|nr:EAL domain-containing protein [Micromonospora sp. CPCC 205371]